LRRNLAEKNVELASATTSLLAFGALLLDWAHRLWPALDRIAWLSPFFYFNPYELVAGSPLCLEDHLVLWAMAMTGLHPGVFPDVAKRHFPLTTGHVVKPPRMASFEPFHAWQRAVPAPLRRRHR
jgi:hypothetical protein